MDSSKTGQLFVMRQRQERYKEKKKIYHIFVNLKKAFDRVPREVIASMGSEIDQIGDGIVGKLNDESVWMTALCLVWRNVRAWRMAHFHYM